MVVGHVRVDGINHLRVFVANEGCHDVGIDPCPEFPRHKTMPQVVLPESLGVLLRLLGGQFLLGLGTEFRRLLRRPLSGRSVQSGPWELSGEGFDVVPR